MDRLYHSLIKNHLINEQEMLFLSGPRQVGKTTAVQSVKDWARHFVYLNWDNEDHRHIILSGPKKISEYACLDQLQDQKPIIAFDELHKRPDWKNFLKGFYDSYQDKAKIVVSGSTRLDVYKQGGDSLMGRYFPYRMHPMSVAELLGVDLWSCEIHSPSKLAKITFEHLYNFGGFPKPFLKHQKHFSIRWQNLRKQQLLHEDIRDMNAIHDLKRLQLLMEILKQNASQQLTYNNLAKFIRVSNDTISRWLEILEAFYFCFRIKPWSKNITRSLLKEPKLFLWDWALVEDPGARAENFVASHLLKAIHYWTDRGFGEYSLYYIRTIDKKEVDFLVSKNSQPWFLVEVKLRNHTKINSNIVEFQKQLEVPHAFQVVIELPYVDKDCFKIHDPVIVPALTFLSQLV